VLLSLPDAPAIVLVHSPLTDSRVWGGVPELLKARGRTVIVVDVTQDNEPPFAAGFIGRASIHISQVATKTHLTRLAFVAHSGAGPLLPHIGATQRAIGHSVTGYVLLDAMVPRPLGARGGNSRLDLLDAADPPFADDLRTLLLDGGEYPNWSEADLADTIADEGLRQTVIQSLRPRDLAWFAEPLPAYQDWPDAPVSYVQTSAAYDWDANQARLRGWLVERHEGGHFAALTNPEEIADTLTRLLTVD